MSDEIKATTFLLAFAIVLMLALIIVKEIRS